jgi:hypothetical protein
MSAKKKDTKPKERNVARADLNLGYTIEAKYLGRPIDDREWVAAPSAFYWLATKDDDISPKPVVSEFYGKTPEEAIQRAVDATNAWLDQNHYGSGFVPV